MGQTNRKHKILLVDDEPDILELVGYNLNQEGYEVHKATDGIDAINVANDILPDLIVIDIMMPKMDGIETCIELRKNPKLGNTLIAFLTARSEDYSQIAGLDAGADDYISKPIKPRVLVSRVKALLRRKPELLDNSTIEAGDLKLDKDKYLLYSDNQEIVLPKKEFELLSLLMSKPGKVFDRDTILHSIWGNDVVVGDRTIDVHIRKLREKIGESTIATIKGVGYKFEST